MKKIAITSLVAAALVACVGCTAVDSHEVTTETVDSHEVTQIDSHDTTDSHDTVSTVTERNETEEPTPLKYGITLNCSEIQAGGGDINMTARVTTDKGVDYRFTVSDGEDVEPTAVYDSTDATLDAVITYGDNDGVAVRDLVFSVLTEDSVLYSTTCEQDAVVRVEQVENNESNGTQG